MDLWMTTRPATLLRRRRSRCYPIAGNLRIMTCANACSRITTVMMFLFE